VLSGEWADWSCLGGIGTTTLEGWIRSAHYCWATGPVDAAMEPTGGREDTVSGKTKAVCNPRLGTRRALKGIWLLVTAA